jgi:hypothetical protein
MDTSGFYCLFNLILVQEKIRPSFLYDLHDDDKILNTMLHLFPSLIISSDNRDTKLISTESINLKEIDSRITLGKILGYPSYLDFEKAIHSNKYNLSLFVKLKHKRNIFNIDIFNYISLSNNDSIQSFVHKSTSIISKYNELLNSMDLHVHHFYSRSEFHFNTDIHFLILGMLIDSDIIEYAPYCYGNKYLSLFNEYFPNLIFTPVNKIKSIISKHNVNDVKNKSKYEASLYACIYNDFYRENVDVYSIPCMTKSKSQFKDLIIKSNQIIHKYPTILHKFDFNISKFIVKF